MHLVRNLTVLAVILIVILAGLLIKDHLSIPTRYLVVFYTSNLRGQLNPFQGETSDRAYEKVGGLAFLRGIIDASLDTYHIDRRHVVLVDTGDSLFGSPEASLTMGEAPFELLRKVGYDAITIGNLEFELGIDTLRKFAKSNKLPMLACNYRDLASPVGNTFQGSILLDKGGIKLGIIGLGMNDLARNTRQENILQIEITDMKAAVQKAASALKTQGAEFIILISHQPALDTYQDLDKLFPDIDLILGDLISTTVLPQSGRPLVLPTPPARGAGVGMVRIPFIGSSWRLDRAIATILPIDATKVKPDEVILNEIAKIESKVDSLLEEVIAVANGDFQRSFSEESSMGDLIADSMKTQAQSDIALLNSGAIKSSFASGPISLRDLYDAIPFENVIMRAELLGWQIENLIEEGLSGRGSFLQGSGIVCTYSNRNPPGFRIIQIMAGDEPLDINRTYSVAATDFMFETVQNWPEFRFGKNPVNLALLREAVKAHLASLATATPLKENRYIELPESDESLRIQTLSLELASLTVPVSNDGTYNSSYGRLIAEVLRTETDSDFAFFLASDIHSMNDPLSVLTPARLAADLPKRVGVSTITMTSAAVEQVVKNILASDALPLCFSGFSVELNNNSLSKIYPWQGDFERNPTWKVALPSDLPESLGAVPASFSATPFSTDVRRTFLNGVRRSGGKIELRRAIF